jgi:hypothetical protein
VEFVLSLIICLLYPVVPPVDGSIQCNSCVYSGGNPITDCLDSPDSAKVALVNCPADTSECTVKSIRPNGKLLQYRWRKHYLLGLPPHLISLMVQCRFRNDSSVQWELFDVCTTVETNTQKLSWMLTTIEYGSWTTRRLTHFDIKQENFYEGNT